MAAEFKMQGYMIKGELHVREADCRRAISDALRTGKEALIKSHDDLISALENLLSFCDVKAHGETAWEKSVARGRRTLAEAKRQS